jgi:hypothetical protein
LVCGVARAFSFPVPTCQWQRHRWAASLSARCFDARPDDGDPTRRRQLRAVGKGASARRLPRLLLIPPPRAQPSLLFSSSPHLHLHLHLNLSVSAPRTSGTRERYCSAPLSSATTCSTKWLLLNNLPLLPVLIPLFCCPLTKLCWLMPASYRFNWYASPLQLPLCCLFDCVPLLLSCSKFSLRGTNSSLFKLVCSCSRTSAGSCWSCRP